MAGNFDPYHKWLGIAPRDQPPNHYRLLGIDAFESDPDVIATAADQRMAHVRTFQTGQNSALSQKLLNQIAAARVCLLSGEKKAAYDRVLQKRMAGSRHSAEHAATNAPASSAAVPDALNDLSAEIVGSSVRRAKKKRAAASKPNHTTVIGSIAAVVALGVGAFLISNGGFRPSDKSPASSPVSAPHQPQREKGMVPQVAHELPDVVEDLTPAPRLSDPATEPKQKLPLSVSAGDNAQQAEETATVADAIEPVQSPPIPDVAHWPLDEGGGVTSRDLSKRGHTLSLHDVAWVKGRHGGALQFDGTRAFAEADSHLPELQIPCTICLWVRPAPRQEPFADVFGTSSDNFQGIHFHQWQERTGFVVGYGDGRRWNSVSVNLQANAWQHVAVVADGKELILYRNGVADARADGTSRLVPNPGLKFMLGRGYPKGRYFAGAIDDVRIYSRALAAAEIALVSQMSSDSGEEHVENVGVAAIQNDEKKRRLAILEPAMAYPATPPNRQPIPDTAARELARKAISDLLKPELKSAKTAEVKKALAEKLKAMAMETKSDPATQFVLFEEAAGLSLNPGTTCQSIDELTARFEVDAFELKAPQLERIAKESPPAGMAGIVDGCLIMSRESMAADRLDYTPRFLAAAKTCAAKTKDRKLGAQIAELSREFERLRKPWEQFRAAAAVLRDKPDDPAANLDVGRYFAIHKADWKRGMPFLANGSDETLKGIALKELTAQLTLEEQHDLANAWWNAAVNEKGIAQSVLQQHAAEYYEHSLPSLSGVAKLRAEQRIAEAAKGRETVAGRQSLYVRLSKAVAARQLTQTDVVGDSRGEKFHDICEGGLLVGLELTTFKFGSELQWTSVSSVKPLYRTTQGVVPGKMCGHGSGPTKTILAKDGYAIGNISVGLVRKGFITGYRATFMKIRGNTLDPQDAYESELVCGAGDQPEMPSLGSGKPIVGLQGTWEDHVRSLSLIEAK